MNLVDEQHVPEFEIRENRGEIALELNQRPGRGPEMRVHLVRENGCESGFSQAWRTVKQNMVQRLATLTGSLNCNVQILFYILLANVFSENARAEGQLEC